jgi:hypothetical protein
VSTNKAKNTTKHNTNNTQKHFSFNLIIIILLLILKKNKKKAAEHQQIFYALVQCLAGDIEPLCTILITGL